MMACRPRLHLPLCELALLERTTAEFTQLTEKG